MSAGYYGLESREPFPEHIIARPRWESDKREPRRYVPERTCKPIGSQPICSICGEVLQAYDGGSVDYCPNCGAKTPRRVQVCG